MDKKKLQDILSASYNLASWQEVLVEVFGVRNLLYSPKHIDGLEPNEKIESVYELGSFETYDKRLIGLFQVNVAPDVWLDKNKVQLRNSLKSIYKYDVDGAIIVFVQKGKWRLSFVAEVKVLNEKNEISNLETHPKRFTYLLGESQLVRTPLMRLMTLMGKQFTLLELREAFSVEALNKEFYLDYNNISRKIINNICPQTIENKLNAHQGALNLLNRLMFVYFIQKKDWLMKDQEFINNFWINYKKEHFGDNLFHNFWLNKVFFKAFNNKAYSDPEIFKYLPVAYHIEVLSFPYLNGGLFSYHPDFDGFLLPDTYFEEIFTFLQRYNFTIKEDSDEEVNLEINPELLGKMYEGMINATDLDDVDAENGIVYTERPEINFMARRSFVEVLDKKLYGIYSREFLYYFCFDNHTEKLELLRKYKIDGFYLRSIVLSITACDPACGSGSMLIGVIQLQLELLRALDEFNGNPHTHKDDFNIKKQIISESIYGVDVKEWAVRIAELRFWLYMIADAEFTAEELTKEPLLPNLDFKLRQGNSLIQQIGSLDFSFEGLFKTKDGKARSRNAGATRSLNYFIKKKKAFITNQVASDTTYEKLKTEELYVFKSFIKELLIENMQQIQRLSLGNRQVSLFEIEIQGSLFENQIAELHDENTQLNQMLNTIQSTGQLPFSFDIDFMEVFLTNENPGFDLVIGNPPYVRQEDILPADDAQELERLLKPENKAEKANVNKAYKEKLSKKIFDTYPFLATKAKTKIEDKTKTIDVYGSKVPGRSDLYVYFQLLAPSLLNSNGTFCFIISNSWLDVEFGGFVQQFLLKHTQLHAIYDCNVRSFSASVNTVIYLHSAIINNQLTAVQYKTFKPKGEPIQFVMNKADYTDMAYAPLLIEQEHCRTNTFRKHYRIITKTPQELWDEGYDIETMQYQSNKWGGKYLRAPEIYFTILEKGKDKLVPLKQIAEVRFGIKSGANEFFIMSREKADEWGIEDEFLVPILKSPKECKTIRIDTTTLPNLLFYCHKEKEELEGTNALKYILWGEESEIVNALETRAFQLRPSTKGRHRWWDVGERKISQGIFPKGISETFVFPKNDVVFADCRLYELFCDNESIMYCLNSSLMPFFIEITSRQGLGDGLLELFVYEVPNYLVPNILIDTEFSIKNRVIGNIFTELGFDRSLPIRNQQPNPLPDRKELDDIIFDELDLTTDERNEVYWATAELVKQRLDKAGSRK